MMEYPNCAVERLDYIENGVCNLGPYYMEECGFDGGDCKKFIEKYPNCNVRYPYQIGDGDCGEYNTAECGYEEGDWTEFYQKYPNCNVTYPYKEIGDCDGGDYYTVECGYDGGDCL